MLVGGPSRGSRRFSQRHSFSPRLIRRKDPVRPYETRGHHAPAGRRTPPDAAPVRPRLLHLRLGLGSPLLALFRRARLRARALSLRGAWRKRGMAVSSVPPLARLRRRPGAGGLDLAPTAGADRPLDGRHGRAEAAPPAAGPRRRPDGPRAAARDARLHARDRADQPGAFLRARPRAVPGDEADQPPCGPQGVVLGRHAGWRGAAISTASNPSRRW